MKAISLALGARYFRVRGGGALGSFISLLATVGLIAGVALLIIVLSVMNGFDRELRQTILRLVPHVEITHDKVIDDWPTLSQHLANMPNVTEVVPQTKVEGMVFYRNKTLPVQLMGYAFGQRSPEVLNELLKKQQLPQPAVGQVLLSQSMVDAMSASVGDRVTFIIPGGKGAAQATSLELVGTFVTHTQLDQALALTSLQQANQLAGLGSAFEQAASLRVQVGDLFQARTQGYLMMGQLPWGYGFRDWLQTYSGLYQSIQLSRNMVGLLVFLIIAIAAFNVISMMMMTVIDKRGDIAVLKTLGLQQSGVLQIFLVQGSFIGLFGVLVGATLGCVGTLAVPYLLDIVKALTGLTLLSTDVYPIDYLPVALRWQDVTMVCGVALVLNFFAALYPAWRASKVHPADELRYE